MAPFEEAASFPAVQGVVSEVTQFLEQGISPETWSSGGLRVWGFGFKV